jgi:flavodoxin
MKSIVVYFSLEGHTRFVADIIAKETGADVFELRPVKEYVKTGFGKYFWGGKSVMFNEKPKLETPLPDFSAYDVIYIGTPIWASSFTPPINTFLADSNLQSKKLMLFACHAGGGAEKCFGKITARLKECKVIGTVAFTDPAEESSTAVTETVRAWVAGIAE